jgi:carbonic anhydrase
MNKQAMLKGAAVLFALMMFTKVNGAATNSAHAAEETKKLREEIAAMSGGVDAAKEAGDETEASDEEATDEESSADEETTADEESAADEESSSHAASKSTAKSEKTTTTKASAKKTTTTLKKATTTTKTAEAIHWSYEGEGGPENWGELDKANLACADGTQQSPIDIANAKVADLPDLKFAWTASDGSVVNNGHTIQVDVKAGGTLTIGATTYTLAQFHFHGPSEHTIGGKNYPLEVHFVHKDASGKLAVVGVLVGEGAENKAFAPIIDKLPSKENTPAELGTSLALTSMLPGVKATYRYAGSLTTPPCSEGVAWNVMAQPMTMSKAQIDAITSHFHEANNRPTQKLNGRELDLDISVDAG